MPAFVVAALLVFLSPPHFGVAADADEPDLEQRFVSLKGEIDAQVAAGQLPEERGEDARSLWVSLKSTLIDIDAEVARRKLESETAGDVSKRNDALDGLVRMGARRARVLQEYLDRLEALAQQGGADPTGRKAGLSNDPDHAREPATSTLPIEFEAEDLIHGEQSLE